MLHNLIRAKLHKICLYRFPKHGVTKVLSFTILLHPYNKVFSFTILAGAQASQNTLAPPTLLAADIHKSVVFHDALTLKQNEGSQNKLAPPPLFVQIVSLFGITAKHKRVLKTKSLRRHQQGNPCKAIRLYKTLVFIAIYSSTNLQ